MQQAILRRYFSRQHAGTYIEAGTGAVPSIYAVDPDVRDWTGINVEPDPVAFRVLATCYPQARNYGVALGDRIDRVQFCAVTERDGGWTGLGGVLAARPYFEHGIPRIHARSDAVRVDVTTVVMVTYRAIVADARLSRVDLLWLTVAGSELLAIDGMHGASVLPGVVVVDHSLVGLDRITGALQSLGYRWDATVTDGLAAYTR